ERGVHQRELAADGRQRAGDEVARAGETRRPELGGAAVVMVEEVVDLAGQLELLRQPIAYAEVHDTVGVRGPGPEIIDAVRVVPVVLDVRYRLTKQLE